MPALPPAYQSGNLLSSIQSKREARSQLVEGKFSLEKQRRDMFHFKRRWGGGGGGVRWEYKIVPHSRSLEMCLILNICLKCIFDAHRWNSAIRDFHDKGKVKNYC